MQKYKNLRNPDQFRKFRIQCEKPFDMRLPRATPEFVHHSVDDDVSDEAKKNPAIFSGDSSEPGPSEVGGEATAESGVSPVVGTSIALMLDEPSSMEANPDVDTERISRTTQAFTPRKVKMKKRLDFVAASSSKRQDKIKELRKQLKTPRKVANQALQRKIEIIRKKNIKIQDLHKQLREYKETPGIAKLELELKKSKKAHKKLISYHRNKAKKEQIESASTSCSGCQRLNKKVKEQGDALENVEYENVTLKEKVEELQSQVEELTSAEKETLIRMKTNEKTYSCMTRMMVFDHIVNNVPTINIPRLILQSQSRAGLKADKIPQRTAVEMMARELGAIAEMQTATTILRSENVTIGFDATTQEGVHVNSIHFTTQQDCSVAAVDQLPGGTAADSAEHIMGTVNRLSESYSYFMEKDLQETKREIIDEIKNSMTDRCAANHAALRSVCSHWKKNLNELNCHLHPPDSFASSSRAALKKLEQRKGSLLGNDCIAANLILQINKLRYKDGKGDPRGFISFLAKHNLPRCVLPRYRGNRLHVLYATSAVLVENYDLFLDFFKSGTSCGGLRRSILQDFTDETAKLELRVLGLLGNNLSGSWMKRFYTSAETETNFLEGIRVVEKVLPNIKVAAIPQNAF